MSEPSSQEPKDEPESNPLDLTDLQSFSFGTQWTDAGKKHKGGDRGTGRGPGQGRRPDRRVSSGGGAGNDRRPPRRPFSDKGPRADGKHGPSKDSPEKGDRRFQNRGQRTRPGGDDRRRRVYEERPYESPIFDVDFYPDDTGFTTIIKALRTNHITYELFHVAKIFLEKSDRFVASVTRKAPKGEKPERVFVSLPDGMPFETEEEAIQHAVTHYAETFFDTEEIEVEAPKGNFQYINRCGITKKLLGPPNYHRYEEFLNHHHQSQLMNMPFEKFKASIEQIQEEEVVSEWLESMKKTTRYTSKVEEGEEPQTFISLSDGIGYLRTTQRDKIVKGVNYARVSGVTLDKFANTEASRAVAGELARQRRFPLETANAIRGRLRREKFSIYKKGSKGVTLICATRRNFRVKGQVMSDTLDRLIRFLETNQNIKAKELPPVFETWLKENFPEAAYDEKKLFQDLHWLIADGYVSHFSDDSLYAQPILENEPKSKPVSSRQGAVEKPSPLGDPAEKGVTKSGEAVAGSEEKESDTAAGKVLESSEASSVKVEETENVSDPDKESTVVEAAETTKVADDSEGVEKEKAKESKSEEPAVEGSGLSELEKPEEPTVKGTVKPEIEKLSEEGVEESVAEEKVVEATEAAVEPEEPKLKEDEKDAETEKEKTKV